VIDQRTGKGHVAVRSESSHTSSTSNGTGPSGGMAGTGKEGGTVQLFARMNKVRFGESLPRLNNQVSHGGLG
jgi:hypothetical protein